ncbi:MAG: 16S rRNA (cytosine(967)-C(5))-methyltransferase [Chlorobium sp.]|nr:MAG: 16S rRNA (cytosine(967)-C(5))-methyltransferase [Chlorobium sp.]
MKTARELALNVLQALETGPSKSDTLLHQALDNSSCNRPDRALATTLVNGVLRYRDLLDFIISHFYHHKLAKAAPVLLNILRLGTYQLLYLDKVPDWAAVNECVKLARKYKGDRLAKLTNGVLRKITPENVQLDQWLNDKEPLEQLSLKYSHPAWLVVRWIETYGRSRTEALLACDNQSPVFGFRINRLKTSIENFFANPALSDIEREECGIGFFFFSKEFLNFEAPIRDGLLSVQNPTQALACLLLNPSSGSTVIDMCAAPGGKSMFMAELMQNKGKIICVDRYEQKLLKLEKHARALGISIIETIAADARSFQPEKKPGFILLDAPCTGTGVLGRRAELRWKLNIETLTELVGLQADLLDHAAELLDTGGILVYATCSIEPEENELQIASFLERHPEFKKDTDCSLLPERFRNEAEENGSLLTLPGDLPSFDGGFCQRMKKI